ncbi:pyridoxal phosphate-dependent decarboxylase family protein [Thiolapillus sp.]
MNEEAIFQRLLALVEQYHAGRKQGKFLDYLEPEALAAELELDRDAVGDWQQLFQWLGKYLQHSVKTGHPGFLNRMWSGANLPSIVGEIITAVTNTSACTYEGAPVSTLIEHFMMETMLDLAGFEEGEGQMTTGSSHGNMVAMLAARSQIDETSKENGLFGQSPLVAFVSADAHYSLDKAANIIGIGTRQLVKVPVDERGRMDPQALEELLQKQQQAGNRPFFVCATLGTTVRGAYDALPPLVELRDKYGFWLHGDGAWGGAALLDDELRRRYLSNIEQLDSFTWDFHKMAGANLMCNVLLFNHHRGTLRCVCSAGEHSYLFREEEKHAELDTGTASLQCGRRVDSLKWFLDWKYFGKEGLAQRVRHYLSLSEYAEQVVHSTPELEMTVPRESFNICFHFRTPEGISGNEFNLELRNRLFKRGISLVGIAYIDEKLTLRLLLTHPEYTHNDVDHFFDTLASVGKELLNEHLQG